MITAGYANCYGFSDVTPFEIVRVVSEKTIEVRMMQAERGEWAPDFRVMGFFARVMNQRDQQWAITSDASAPVERVRLNQRGEWRNGRGRFMLAEQPIRFYDYNF